MSEKVLLWLQPPPYNSPPLKMAGYPDWLPPGLIYDRHLISQIRNEQALHHMQDADVKAILDASIQDAQQLLEAYLQYRTGCQNYHPALLSGTAIKCLLSTVDIADMWNLKKREKAYADIDEFTQSLCWGSPKEFIHILQDFASAPLNDLSPRACRVARRANEVLTFRKFTFDRPECHSFLTTVQLKMQVQEFAASHSGYTTSMKVGLKQHRRLITDVYNYAIEVGLNKAEALACADAAVDNLTIFQFLQGSRFSVPPNSSRVRSSSKRKAEDPIASSSPLKKAKTPASKRTKKQSQHTEEEPRVAPAISPEPAVVDPEKSPSPGAVERQAKEEKRRQKEKRRRKEAKKLRKDAKRKAREEAKLHEAEEQKLREEKKRRKEEKKKRREERERRKSNKVSATTPDLGKAKEASETLWTAINQDDPTNNAPNAIRKDSHQEASSEPNDHESQSSSPSSDEGLPRVPASQPGSPVDSPSKQLWGESETHVVRRHLAFRN